MAESRARAKKKKVKTNLKNDLQNGGNLVPVWGGDLVGERNLRPGPCGPDPGDKKRRWGGGGVVGGGGGGGWGVVGGGRGGGVGGWGGGTPAPLLNG